MKTDQQVSASASKARKRAYFTQKDANSGARCGQAWQGGQSLGLRRRAASQLGAPKLLIIRVMQKAFPFDRPDTALGSPAGENKDTFPVSRWRATSLAIFTSVEIDLGHKNPKS